MKGTDFINKRTLVARTLSDVPMFKAIYAVKLQHLVTATFVQNID